MKRVFFVGVCMISICGGLYTQNVLNKKEINEMVMQNVEALSEEESGKGCKLHLTSICETQNKDHYLFRNR